ncbi:MAG TPA: pentapeptide repeat-containing protein, partial [Arenicellales bacterium]|nr:pentapeptide repeat-containing protein [Arenicellales bacterium]
MFLLAMGATWVAYAFSPADAGKALKANACIKCDLTRVDFHDKHLAGVNLKWARLNSSNLAATNLAGANLYGAFANHVTLT